MLEFWKQKLDRAEQAIYQTIKDSFAKGELNVSIPQVSECSIKKIMRSIEFDHPELYFMSPQYGIMTSTGGGLFRMRTFQTLQTHSIYTQSQIRMIDLCFDRVVSEILSHHGNEEDLEKRICSYLVQNTNYEIDAIHNQNAAAALYFHRAQCSGIAKAVKFLMDRASLWCIVVAGDAKQFATQETAHAWNIVRINGKYFHLDVTSMIGSNGNLNAFFNYSDEAMTETHNWNRGEVPQCVDSRYDPISFSKPRGERKVVEVKSESQIFELFKNSPDGISFFSYTSSGRLEDQQTAIMDLARKYCMQINISATIHVGYAAGVWTVEIKKT